MAYKVYREGGYFYIVDTGNNREYSGLAKDVTTQRGTTNDEDFFFNNVENWKNNTPLNISDIQKENGDAYTTDSFIQFYQGANVREVHIQDQHSAAVVALMSTLEQETLLTDAVAIDDHDIVVDTVTGFTVGKYVSVFDIVSNRFYLGFIISVNVNTLTMDTPLDFAFPSGSFVTAGDTNMGVDGSVTPVIFGLRNTDQAIGTAFDITRIMISCLADSAVTLAKFGNIDALTNGVVFRKKDGKHQNIFNAKTNDDLKNLMFDFDITSAQNPQQGEDGFHGRFTFGGQNRVGVVIRLEPGEDVQLIVQDDLTGLSAFNIIAEGHEVD